MGIAGLIATAVLFFLYLKTLPAEAKDLLVAVPKGLTISLIISFSLVLLYFIYFNMRPLSLRLIPSILFILVLFIGIFSAKRGREILRKPYVIPKYMYSNQLIAIPIPSKGVKEEVSLIKEKGILNFSPFVPASLRKINNENQLEVGRLIALMQCSSCHTLNKKGLRPLPKMVKKRGLNTVQDAEDLLDMLDAFPYMPPFLGTEEEKKVLANYLIPINREETMEVAKIIESLRDPMGIPFYPIVFQFLMVLTFTLHILFVNFTLGTSFLSIYGYLKKGEYWRRLSRSLVNATIVNISMAILFE